MVEPLRAAMLWLRRVLESLSVRFVTVGARLMNVTPPHELAGSETRNRRPCR